MILLIALIFIILLIAPLMGSGIYYKKYKGKILNINQNKIRDPRYFGKSFAALIENNLSKIKQDIIILSKPEKFIDADTYTEHDPLIQNLVIAKNNNYNPSQVVTFKKEIYGGKNIIFGGHNQLELRAAYSRENMIIGPNTTIIRWIDASGTVAVYDCCDLGISASSGMRMSIGENCKFRRLYAPEIRLGQYPEDNFDAKDGKDPKIYNMPIQMNKEKNIRYITSEMINEEGVVDYTVLSRDNLHITENIIIQGDVRSHEGVRLSDGAVVCGNVFAEKDVYLGKNACVLGSIFSQENIYFEEGAVAGQKGRICSVVARGNITFEKRNFVFGYISCEKQGLILKSKNKKNTKIKKELTFLGILTGKTKLEFKDLYEYEHIDQQGFRYNQELKEVILPKDATIMPKSMFFSCESLQTVILSHKLKKIESYGFADCKSLENISLAECIDLKKIGVSAFENCTSLKFIEIPASVLVISGAAFSRCTSLKKVEFAEDSKLVVLEDHCFRGCESLEEIKIPSEVKKIGVSAFKECLQLKKVIVPETCKNEVGILEIPKEKVEFYDVESKKVAMNEGV